MENEEHQGSARLKLVHSSYNDMRVDVKISSISLLQSKQIDSCEEEHATRIRKPYTITKQRERWTEDEHKKFIEALQLYGRAWRRIEEHVGTKTAVQIRSHAQKFFSKVVRESGSIGNAGTLKAIEIPPPRPKRKPLHPYPRKLGNLSNKGSLVVKQHERPPLQFLANCEQENRSPKSVLSAIGSETLESTHPNGQVGCSSPVSSGDGSNDQDDCGQSLAVKVQEENNLPLSNSPVPKLTAQDQPPMEIDECSNVETSSAAQTPTLKLFGKMLSVTGSNTSSGPSAGPAGDVAQSNLTLCTDIPGDKDDKDFGWHPKSDCSQSPVIGVCPKDLTLNAVNAYPGFMPPLIYCYPFVRDNSTVEAALLPPWWPVYGNHPPKYVVHPQPQLPPGLSKQFAGNQEVQMEGSWTGSNTASTSGAGLGDHNADSADSNKDKFCSNLKPSNTPSSTSEIAASGRAFVPYKRCAVASEVQHSSAPSDEGESLAVRLCL